MRMKQCLRTGLAVLALPAMLGLASCGSGGSAGEAGAGAIAGGGSETAVAATAGTDGSDGTGGVEIPQVAPPEDATDLTSSAAVTVEVGDNKYTIRKIIVAPGTEVTFENVGLNRHNVVASVPGTFEDIDLEQLDDGGSVSRTFDAPGEYAYYCSIHGSIDNGQRGWVYVAAA